MDDIFQAIGKGQPEEALIRLWVAADQTVEDRRQDTVWEAASQKAPPLKLDLAAWLEAPDPAKQKLIEQHPLQLLKALDQRLHHQYRDSYTPPPNVTIGDNTFALIRRRYPRNIPASRQSPCPETRCQYHSVIPLRFASGGGTLNVDILRLDQYEARGRNEADEVRIRLSHFNDDVLLELQEDAANSGFHATGVSDPKVRQEKLSDELLKGIADGVHFWVAPELTAPLAMQHHVRQSLADDPDPALLLCVPGSFHVDEARGRFNIATVFNGHGKEFPSHSKLTRFSYTGRGEQVFHEDIQANRRITVLDTPLGLVGIAICKDFSDASDPLISFAWDSIAPDWMLVPSYGDEAKTLKLHREKAKEHWTIRNTRSVVANQQPGYRISGGPTIAEEAAPGFIHSERGYEQVREGGSTLEVIPTKRPELQRIK